MILMKMFKFELLTTIKNVDNNLLLKQLYFSLKVGSLPVVVDLVFFLVFQGSRSLNNLVDVPFPAS